MSNLIARLHDRQINMQRPDNTTPSAPSRSATGFSQRQKDPNTPIDRLSLSQQCIYERPLPGGSYVSAHLTRLQLGYYDSPEIHNDKIDNVCFMAINFIFHPADTRHRFTRAKIKLSLTLPGRAKNSELPILDPINRSSANRPQTGIRPTNKDKPKFLRFAPHVIYGALSPETLDWNFNLAGSLGVTQGPANASLQPSGGLKSSYKIYKSMKIQGSLRTLEHWANHDYDVDDGELMWTMEENALQKSGLPREFTFVVLMRKGDPANQVIFDIDVEPVVGSWYGTYPKWWLHRIWYQPLHKQPVDLNKQLGQSFEPSSRTEGFNFANLMGCFDDFVTLPGTTYATSDQLQTTTPGAAAASSPQKKQQPQSASPAPINTNDINLRISFDGNYRNVIGDRTNAIPRPVSSHSLLPIQSTSPLPRSNPSKSKQRERPVSARFDMSPPPERSTPVTKQRPVSAIYESDLPPSTFNAKPYLQSEHFIDRQNGNGKSSSGEKSRSPLPFEITPGSTRSPRSLRHRRSRDGLVSEYSAHDTPSRARPKAERQPQKTENLPSGAGSQLPNGTRHPRHTSFSIGRRPSSVSSSSPSPPLSDTNSQAIDSLVDMTAASPSFTRPTSSNPNRISYPLTRPDTFVATPSAAALESMRYSTDSTIVNNRPSPTYHSLSTINPVGPKFPPSSFPSNLRNSTSDQYALNNSDEYGHNNTDYNDTNTSHTINKNDTFSSTTPHPRDLKLSDPTSTKSPASPLPRSSQPQPHSQPQPQLPASAPSHLPSSSSSLPLTSSPSSFHTTDDSTSTTTTPPKPQHAHDQHQPHHQPQSSTFPTSIPISGANDVDVTTIVQRELDHFLKSHPELYRPIPIPGTNNSRPVTSSGASASSHSFVGAGNGSGLRGGAGEEKGIDVDGNERRRSKQFCYRCGKCHHHANRPVWGKEYNTSSMGTEMEMGKEHGGWATYV